MLDSVVWIPTQHFRSSLLVWFRLVWFGLAWFGLARLGLVWPGLVWLGLVWFGDFGQHLFSSSKRKDSWNIFWISEGRGSLKSLNASFSVSEFHSFQRVFFGCTFWNNSWFKTENHGVLPSFKFFRRFFGVLGTFFGGPWRFPKRFGVAFAIWKVWTLDGEGKAFLKTESALVQVHGHPKSPGSVQVVTVFF